MQLLYAIIALVCTATKPTAPQPPKFIYATKNEVKQQLALAKQRLDNNGSDVKASHAVAKILRALGDVDGEDGAVKVALKMLLSDGKGGKKKGRTKAK